MSVEEERAEQDEAHGRTTFFKENGRWMKRQYPRKCDGKIYGVASGCQGWINHDGDCWAYQADGTFLLSTDRRPEQHQPQSFPWWCDGYISPQEMHRRKWDFKYIFSEVTDAAEIQRLEVGEVLYPGECIDYGWVDPV